ncbi:MAG: electron transfer flavoprotein subunit alpha/FixB family protein, partial [Mycobacteriales bacterium]
MTTSSVLVLVEHAAGRLSKVTAELLTAARSLGEPTAVVIDAADTAG